MSTNNFIIALFYRVDLTIGHLPKHPQSSLYPSKIVTLALLFAFKGGSGRAFYRWLWRDYSAWFPGLPERTRLFRLFAAHQEWAEYVLVEPTTLGVIDSYGIELVHPWREHRTDGQLASKGCPTIGGSSVANWCTSLINSARLSPGTGRCPMCRTTPFTT